MIDLSLLMSMYVSSFRAGDRSPSQIILQSSRHPELLKVEMKVTISKETEEGFEKMAEYAGVTKERMMEECLGFGYVGLGSMFSVIQIEEEKVNDEVIKSGRVSVH